jgi:alkanesulfonate monooxygenase
MSVVPITSPDLDACEVSWFAALCSDDYRFLGVPEGDLRSRWAHCSAIVKRAEGHGFRTILWPSSYQVGQDTLAFVAGCAPITRSINFLAAIRCGKMQPVILARTAATLDHMLEGRLTLNVISSDFPGEIADSAFRYKRSHEVVEILRQALTRDHIEVHGDIYRISKLTADPARPYQQNGGPLLYFGGYSPTRLNCAGRNATSTSCGPRRRTSLPSGCAMSTPAWRRMAGRWTTACVST